MVQNTGHKLHEYTNAELGMMLEHLDEVIRESQEMKGQIKAEIDRREQRTSSTIA